MSELTKEIAEITARYKKEMAALNEKYLKKLEEIKVHAASLPSAGREKKVAHGHLKEKIETNGPTYFS